MASYNYDEKVLKVFLENQGQLFDEPVADDLESADEFLDMMMAYVAKSVKEVKEYFEELGADVDGDILEASEVFAIGDGRYLIVEG
ncbi:MAG: glyoxalase [Lachnospiraceae bacterium]|nr:glyoxalase [Lachnospiraceae bacterium]